ncbi:MAG: alpha-galactosidase [Arachidicoccus sp.]|nr:alpha-galactosidase [Arachidicoccus sp.]
MKRYSHPRIKPPFFKNPLLFCICVFSVCSVKAQNTDIPIETQNTALVLQTDRNNGPHIVYFGKKLKNKSEYDLVQSMYEQNMDYTGIANSPYTPAGSRNLFEPAIEVTHADGNNSLDLKFISAKTEKISDDISLTSVLLKDPVYDFQVTLFYKIYFKENVVEQWSEIKNNEKGNVTLHKFASANLYLQGKSFYLKQYHGDWAQEMHPEEEQITHGIKTLDSKLGTRADLFQPPVFMVSVNQSSNEDNGEVLLGSVEWSGNYRTDLELDNKNNLRIISGINNYASDYPLEPGKIFTTAKFLYTVSYSGTGDASRQLQRWARDYKLLDGNGSRLTLLNNWESTYFNFDEEKLKQLFNDTKKLGVNLFLLDDGWFGNKYPRNNDRAGLGDWQENKKKIPNGIASLIKEANADGVQFGIWLEPEMVNPKSELYEKHPDWVIRQPKRPEYYFRNQLELDLSNPKVQDFVFGVIDSLFIKNPGLAYIKWDCNAVIYNAYHSYENNQSKLYVDYVQGLYSVLKHIRAKYPTVPMMLCSGGGGRVDYGALQYFTEYWPSDNTDPLERIFIQWEYSYFYPAIASSNHVTDWGQQPLKYRVDVAMMGKLGFDIPVSKLSEKDLAFCQSAVKIYNSFKNIVWHGDQYRLQSPWTNDVAAIIYVDSTKSSAVVFNYLVNNRYNTGSALPVHFKGLDANRKYKIKEINLYPGTHSTLKENAIYSGDFLMTVGFNPGVNADRPSVVLMVEEVD